MTRLLFDTTFLIDAERSADELHELIEDDDDVAVAAVTIAEPRGGRHPRRSPTQGHESRVRR